MPEQPDIHKRFTEAMVDIYRRALRELDYRASRFLQMVTEHGGYETAMTLIHAPQPSEGYTALWERHRLDLTVEAVILLPEWHDLFTDDDRRVARARLEQYDYDFGAQH
jgi:hypothetical protein